MTGKSRALAVVLAAMSLAWPARAGESLQPADAPCSQACRSWAVAEPSSVGLDPAVVDAFIASAEALNFVDGVLVTRRDAIVAEYYARGFDRMTPHQISSVSKGIISALVGIAVGRGDISSVETPLPELLPDVFAEKGIEPEFRTARLRDALTMSLGFKSSDSWWTYWRWNSSKDRVRHTLRRNPKFPPGTHFAYSNGGAHLVSRALTEATGQSTRAFAEQVLFGQLGIEVADWPTDDLGTYVGGTNMKLTLRDLARFATLYLNRGQYEGRQIIPEDWIVQSTAPSGLTPDPDDWGPYDYGYFWWLGHIAGNQVILGRGWGGQSLFIVPALGMVVIVVGDGPLLPETAKSHRLKVAAVVNGFLEQVAPVLNPELR